MKLTTGMFFLPDGLSTQHGGVPSDIVIPTGIQDEEKKLDYSLPQGKIPSFVSKEANGTDPSRESSETHWKPLSASQLKALAAASNARVAKD